MVLAVALVERDAFADAEGSTWARAPDLGGYAFVAAAALGWWVVAVTIVAGRRVGAIELATPTAAFVAACACVAGWRRCCSGVAGGPAGGAAGAG